MNDYLKAWRKEHAKILEALVEILGLDIFSKAGQMKLQELKRALDVHLKSEDLNLYPALKKAAETDADLRRKLFLFAADMQKISSEVEAFFRKEENEPLGKDIPEGFKKIAALIKSRILREEKILMEKYPVPHG